MDDAALTKVLTYIQAHLDSDISLGAVAAIAGCSAPHFLRRFAGMMDETPKQYTLRLRLERAALRLVLLEDSILRIALDCGFTCHETFSRAFRRRFGLAPRAFRAKGKLPASSEAEPPQRVESAAPTSLSNTVVRTLQPMSLAFIRHYGPYEDVPVALWDKLIDWARRRGLREPYVLMGIAHDAPGITRPEDLRFDAALRVPESFRSERTVGHQRFAGGSFALTTNVGPLASLPAAYQQVFGRIRRERSLVCLGLPCVEFYQVHRPLAEVAIVSTEIAVPVRGRGRGV